MADQHSAKEALVLTITICDDTIASFNQISQSRFQAVTPSQDPSIIHKDFISLLSLLYGSATKVSLALKPASPTYNASLTPLREIGTHVNALTHCAALFYGHGKALQHEVIMTAISVIESIRVLLRGFLEIVRQNQEHRQADETYLIKLGAVHDHIDRARADKHGLSNSNIRAIQKILAANQESLDDAVEETDQMIKGADGDEVVEEDGNFDDGWGEIGLGSDKKLNPQELDRIRKVHLILRLSSLLHKRIQKDLPPSLPDSVTSFPTLDELPGLSSSLTEAFDELVATSYGHDPREMVKEVSRFQTLVGQMREFCDVLFTAPDLTERMGHSSAVDNVKSKSASQRTWFITCFSQLDKAFDTLFVALEPDALST